MKKKILISFGLAILLFSCQSNQRSTLAEEKKSTDSSAKKIQSEIDKMVDEMAPPDSNYSGEFFLKYDNGLMKVKGYFRFGKRHGQWFYYYPGGYVWSEGLFNNGKMDGPSKVYHENGKIYYEGTYKLDKAVGVWNFYDTTGTLSLVRTYDSTGKVLSDKPVSPETKK
ncbi:MAG TPA: hypothetical protein VNY73_06380 [Bacteroidia bacterium]|nr:hypothetical protein [Bacteroidia bacterium]